MAQAPKYNRGYSFEDYQNLNPTAPLPGTSVDQEYDSVSDSLNKTIENLGLIQSDDGGVREGVVDEDALTPEVRDKLNSGGGEGGGAVNSVNGKQGDVLLSTTDIPEGTLALYMTPTEKSKLATVENNAQVNAPIATQAEAQAGVDNTKTMTPLRVDDYFNANYASIPNYEAVNRTFDLTPIFDRQVTYDDYTQVGATNIVYGVPDASWVNGAEQVLDFTGDGNPLTFDTEFIDRDTGLNDNIYKAKDGETVTYVFKWNKDKGEVIVSSRKQYLRTDGLLPMQAPLDHGGFDLLNCGGATFSRGVRSVPANLAYQPSIQLDFNVNSHIIGALTGALTLSNPLNQNPNAGGIIYLDCRGVAADSVSFGTNWRILDGQDPAFPAKECLITYWVPFAGTVAYSRRELN